MITGTMYLSAMRLASSAIQKQSPGVAGAETGPGPPRGRPRPARQTAALPVLVGRPGGRHEAEGERAVAADVAVEARLELRRRHFVPDLERLGRIAVRVARLHGQLVRLGQHRLAPELLVQPLVRVVHRPVVEPVA